MLSLISQNKIFIVLSIVAVFLAGLFQNTELVSFYGIKINLVLVLTLAFGIFIEDLWHYLALSLVGILMLKTALGLDSQTLALLIILLAAFYFKDHLFGKPIINLVFLIIVGTLLFYLFLDPRFLISGIFILFLELIYNVITGLVAYLTLEKIYYV